MCGLCSRGTRFELVLSLFSGNGEIYSLPYVKTELCLLWLIEECKDTQQRATIIFPVTYSLTPLTKMEPLLDPWKLEKGNAHGFF